VLEAGVGTGLALRATRPDKRVVGIDLSAEMLARARARVAAAGTATVETLLETGRRGDRLPEAGFDIAVAMFVASVCRIRGG